MIDLEQLEEDLRATRVEMAPRKKADLQSRLQDAQKPQRQRSWTWFLRPAAALATVAVIGVGIASIDRDDDLAQFSGAAPNATEESSGGGAGSVAAPESPAANAAPPVAQDSAALPTLSAPAPAREQSRLAGRRFVEKTTSLSLTTDADGLQDVANGIVRETKEAGGVVDTSSVSKTEDGGSASFSLRIPSARLPAAVAALSELGDVVGLDEAGQDITGGVASASERLSEARAERRGILRSLQRADTDAELRALRARLREVRSRISRAQGDLGAVRRRADIASVQVEVSASGAERQEDEGGVWSPGDAASDAWDVLQVVAGVLLVAAAVLAPLGLLAALTAVAVKGSRRRRREHALDTM